MSDQAAFNKVAKFLAPHASSKIFVQRIFEPQQFPAVQNPDGSSSTHRMRVDHLFIGDKEVPAMYPTIFWKDGYNIDFGDDIEGAKEYAIKNNEYIKFDNLDDALWMERNWKRLWGQPPRRDKK
jgi:hypothetical protein